MKKLLIGTVVIAAIALFGGNYYYSQQIEKRLDQIAAVASQFGAQFRYREVSISLSGDIRIDQIRFEPPGPNGVLNIKRAAVHTGDTLGVHRLVKELRAQRLPEQLGLSLEGLQMIGLEIPAGAGPLPADGQVESLLTQLCQKGVDGGAAPLSDRTMDVRMNYRLVGQGQLMELEMVNEAHELYQMALSAEVSVGASSRSAAAVAMAMSQASLLEAELRYRDQGYLPLQLRYCERQTELSRPALIDRHLEQWQQAWHALGLVAGDTVSGAYRDFVENPDQVTMTFTPAGGLNMAEMTRDWSSYTFESLRLSLSFNGEPVEPLDIRAMTPGEREQRQAERAARIEAERPAAEVDEAEREAAATRRSIPVDRLRQHMNVDMVLVTGDGEPREGRIVDVVDGYVRFRQYQRGGYIVQPIPLAQIVRAYRPVADDER